MHKNFIISWCPEWENILVSHWDPLVSVSISDSHRYSQLSDWCWMSKPVHVTHDRLFQSNSAFYHRILQSLYKITMTHIEVVQDGIYHVLYWGVQKIAQHYSAPIPLSLRRNRGSSCLSHNCRYSSTVSQLTTSPPHQKSLLFSTPVQEIPFT